MKTLLAVLLLAALSVGAQTANQKKPETSFLIDSTAPSTSVAVLEHEGPRIEIIVVEKGQATELLRIKDKDDKMLITVHMDGSISVDNGFKADDQAREFWKALAQYYGPVCNEAFSKGKP